jgi:uncharacterized protein (TIGR02231 family)
MSAAFHWTVRWLAVAAASLAVSVVPGTASVAAESPSGPVTHVTLYLGQAMAGRTIQITGPKGAKEIVVADLPEQVVPESLFAEGSEGIEIRSVLYRTRAVGEEPRDEVRKLDDAIKQVQAKIELNKKAESLLTKQMAYLDQLEGFVATTAKTDLSRGVLDADALQKVTLFSFEQRKTVSDKLAPLEKDAKDLADQLTLLQRRRGELTSGASRTAREAVLFVEKRGAAAESVRLNYLVSNCGWTPAYTLRAGPDGKEVRVECHGLIRQMSGEDWNNVQLVLSTASPALSASGPGLGSFPVVLDREADSEPPSAKELASQLDAIRDRLAKALAQHQSAVTAGEKTRLDWALNSAANEFQNLELISGKDLVSTLRTAEMERGRGPSLTYALPAPVSLASRSDQQMVQVFQTKFASRFHHLAAPVLTGHVYREAELINTGDQDLLAGPTSAYLDGRFVGRGEIPTVARGQMFVPGFGADPQLRTRRELVDRTESVQGGNRKLEFKYRLILENYKPEAALVRIYDRLPYGEGATDVRVTLSPMKDPLDENQLYQLRERPKGLLRWEISVPAAAVREKARIIEYGFSVEFDRNFQLSTRGGKQEQAEFEQIQRAKAAPSRGMGGRARTPSP